MKRVSFICCLLAMLGLSALSYSNCSALDLSKLEVYFLQGDFDKAIQEGELIQAEDPLNSHNKDLYYILALSYLKAGNYLRASDIYEIILNEFDDKRMREESLLGLGDVYLLQEDCVRAKNYYNTLLSEYPDTKFKAALFYRMSQCEKNQDTGEYFFEQLKSGFPMSPEAQGKQDTGPAESDSADYCVQVGAFASDFNAGKLSKELKDKGYPAYIEKYSKGRRTLMRVRVGKFATYAEAKKAQQELIRQGYPAKIYP